MTCVIKDSYKFYPQLCLEEYYIMNKHNTKHLKNT